MRKKSQVAMESLMVYGIAILIVMLAIGALIYFGVLDLGSYLPDKCNLPGNIKCENYLLTSHATAGTLELELRNSVGKNIEYSNIALVGTEDWAGVACTYTPAAGSTPAQTTLGKYKQMNGDLTRFVLTCGATVPTTVSGKKVKGSLTATYNVVGSTIAQNIKGEIQTKAK
jgi:hypothetical protein